MVPSRMSSNNHHYNNHNDDDSDNYYCCVWRTFRDWGCHRGSGPGHVWHSGCFDRPLRCSFCTIFIVTSRSKPKKIVNKFFDFKVIFLIFEMPEEKFSSGGRRRSHDVYCTVCVSKLVPNLSLSLAKGLVIKSTIPISEKRHNWFINKTEFVQECVNVIFSKSFSVLEVLYFSWVLQDHWPIGFKTQITFKYNLMNQFSAHSKISSKGDLTESEPIFKLSLKTRNNMTLVLDN